jgi:glycosyltransferase involved in cell wall biosynthesis
MDVFVCASKGESFCLPLVEAQSCGVPAIVTDTTALPEMLYGGWKIPVEEDDYEWAYFGGWWPKVRAQSIYEQMETAYQEWKSGSIKVESDKAKLIVNDFDWDKVYANNWKPLLKELEEKKCI